MYIENSGILLKKVLYTTMLTKQELLDLKKTLDNTLLKYDMDKYDDEYVSYVNDISKSSFKSGKKKKQTPQRYGCDLYLIHNVCLNILKIGISGDVYKRFNTIQNEGFYNYDLLFNIKNKSEYESIFHKKYDLIRLVGEWFEYSDDILIDFKLLSE